MMIADADNRARPLTTPKRWPATPGLLVSNHQLEAAGFVEIIDILDDGEMVQTNLEQARSDSAAA